jgi:hypothetical protein
MSSHYEKDQVTTFQAIKIAEDRINDSSRIWANILRLGHGTGQAKKCRETLLTEYATIPVLQGYRKDHKADIEGSKVKGPPLRPLCAANKALNAPLGDLLATILKAVGDEVATRSGTELTSTEELCRAAHDANLALVAEHDLRNQNTPVVPMPGGSSATPPSTSATVTHTHGCAGSSVPLSRGPTGAPPVTTDWGTEGTRGPPGPLSTGLSSNASQHCGQDDGDMSPATLPHTQLLVDTVTHITHTTTQHLTTRVCPPRACKAKSQQQQPLKLNPQKSWITKATTTPSTPVCVVESTPQPISAATTTTSQMPPPPNYPFQGDEVCLGGMDVCAMYPSILKDMAGLAAEEAISTSEMEWDVDGKHLARYVALMVPRNIVEEKGLGEVVPKAKTKTTLHSYADPKGKAKQTNGDNQFDHQRNVASPHQTKHILGLATSAAIQQCMDSHFYRIGEEVRKQTDGGSIGSSLTGEASRVYMLKWDTLFKAKITSLGLHILMYMRYVDDITILVRNIHHCWVYNPVTDRMVYGELTGDPKVSNESHTFAVLQSIANAIHPQIQLTVDVPGNHPDNRMPVLDLKMWVAPDHQGVPTVHHSFYKKPVSSPYTIKSSSAMSAAVKRHTHFQEALRRLRNVDPSQPWAEKAWHLTTWGNMLRVSGYTAQYRHRILVGAILRHNKLLEDWHTGKIPSFYRTRKEMVEAKQSKGKSSAATWFLKGQVTGTLDVVATPNSVLATSLQKLLKGLPTSTGGLTKVVEGGGVPITMGLKKANPFKLEGCAYKDPKCRVNPKVDCGKMGGCYAVTCDSCGDVVPLVSTTPTLPSTIPQQGPSTVGGPTTTTTTTTHTQGPLLTTRPPSDGGGVVVGPATPHTNNNTINIPTQHTQVAGPPQTPGGPSGTQPHQGPTQELVQATRANWALATTGRAQVTAGSRVKPRNNRGKTKDSGGPKGPQKLPKVFQEFDTRPHYLGQTARSLHKRMAEHSTSAAQSDTKNAMARHKIACHSMDLVQPKFTMTLVSSHTKNVERQGMEGILLERQDPELSWNDRMEWGRKNNGVIRIWATNV